MQMVMTLDETLLKFVWKLFEGKKLLFASSLKNPKSKMFRTFLSLKISF